MRFFDRREYRAAFKGFVHGREGIQGSLLSAALGVKQDSSTEQDRIKEFEAKMHHLLNESNFVEIKRCFPQLVNLIRLAIESINQSKLTYFKREDTFLNAKDYFFPICNHVFLIHILLLISQDFHEPDEVIEKKLLADLIDKMDLFRVKDKLCRSASFKQGLVDATAYVHRAETNLVSLFRQHAAATATGERGLHAIRR